MIKKRYAVGMLFTPSQDFMITKWKASTKIGMENETEVDKEEAEDIYYYPRPGVLEIKGSYVYKEFATPQEVYIYVD